MAQRVTPPFRADHVGSLLRPHALLTARAQRARGDISAQELEQREDAAISEAVKMQVDVVFGWPPTENSGVRCGIRISCRN